MQLPARLDKKCTALVVIDTQNDYCTEGGFFDRVMHENLQATREMIPRLHKALGASRGIKLPIIFVQTLHDSYTASETYKARMRGVAPNFCRPDTWGAEIVKELRPRKGEIVTVKHRYSAFIDSTFPLIVRSMGLKNLLFAGTATNVCVESTLRDAVMYDYFPVLLSDCVSAYDKELHDATLKNVSNNFGAVATSDEVLKRIS